MTVARKDERFWFGYLGSPGAGSIVLWDRRDTGASQDEVRLFHYARDELILYKKDIVRKKLQRVDERDYSLLSSVVSAYFELRTRLAAARPEPEEPSLNDLYYKSLQRPCYDCNGSGFELDGAFGSFMCRTCNGWGRIE